MKYLFGLLLCFFIFSCSNDSSEEDNAPDAEFSTNFVTAEVKNIQPSSVTIDVQITNPSFAGAFRKVLYRIKSGGEYTERNAGVINGLVRGQTYEYFVRISYKGTDYDLPVREFTTQGFVFDNEFVFGEVIDPHKKYRFINTSANGDMLIAAQPLRGYLKIGNDSIEVSNLTVAGDIALDFEINDSDTQQFFEGDDGGTMLKTFGLGLFSGDFYAEIVPKNETNYDGQSATPWSLFNKKPHIREAFVQDVPQCIEENNGRAGAITLKGNFWGGLNTSFSDDEINVYDNFTLRLYSKDNPEIERVYTGGEIITENFYTNCETEGMRRIREIIDGAFQGFHPVNMLNIRYNPLLIEPGNYGITFAVEKDNVVYISEEIALSVD